MSQSNRIFAFMALAFVVFITMKGELPVYLGFILSTPKQPAGGSNNAEGATSPLASLPELPKLASMVITGGLV